jgi:hypothetical protein
LALFHPSRVELGSRKVKPLLFKSLMVKEKAR